MAPVVGAKTTRLIRAASIQKFAETHPDIHLIHSVRSYIPYATVSFGYDAFTAMWKLLD